MLLRLRGCVLHFFPDAKPCQCVESDIGSVFKLQQDPEAQRHSAWAVASEPAVSYRVERAGSSIGSVRVSYADNDVSTEKMSDVRGQNFACFRATNVVHRTQIRHERRLLLYLTFGRGRR